MWLKTLKKNHSRSQYWHQIKVPCNKVQIINQQLMRPNSWHSRNKKAAAKVTDTDQHTCKRYYYIHVHNYTAWNYPLNWSYNKTNKKKHSFKSTCIKHTSTVNWYPTDIINITQYLTTAAYSLHNHHMGMNTDQG